MNEDLNCLVKNLMGAYFYDSEEAAKAKVISSWKEIVVPVKITYKEEKI